MTADGLDIVTARLRIVGEPMRIRLMWLLDEHGAATVQELCDHLPPTTHQNVSRHLGVLHQAGIVKRAPEGNYVRYELVDWTALWVIDQITSSIASHLELQSELLGGTTDSRPLVRRPQGAPARV